MSHWEFPSVGGHMDKATQIYLQNMTGLQVEERIKKNDVIILPIGSTEAHGPHAPSGEDTFLVTRMAELVAQKTGCTVAQPVWYGSHPYHHLGMPGTIVIPEQLLLGFGILVSANRFFSMDMARITPYLMPCTNLVRSTKSLHC
jgi:hypothetical protein